MKTGYIERKRERHGEEEEEGENKWRQVTWRGRGGGEQVETGYSGEVRPGRGKRGEPEGGSRRKQGREDNKYMMWRGENQGGGGEMSGKEYGRIYVKG